MTKSFLLNAHSNKKYNFFAESMDFLVIAQFSKICFRFQIYLARWADMNSADS